MCSRDVPYVCLHVPSCWRWATTAMGTIVGRACSLSGWLWGPVVAILGILVGRVYSLNCCFRGLAVATMGFFVGRAGSPPGCLQWTTVTATGAMVGHVSSLPREGFTLEGLWFWVGLPSGYGGVEATLGRYLPEKVHWTWQIHRRMLGQGTWCCQGRWRVSELTPKDLWLSSMGRARKMAITGTFAPRKSSCKSMSCWHMS